LSGRSLPAPRRGGPTLRGDDLSRSPRPLRLLDWRGDESVNAGQGSGEEQDKGEQDHQEPGPRVIRSPSRRGTAVVTRSSFRKVRSEEHTSELQSRFDLVCRLLLEKKNIRYVSLKT